MKENDPYVQAMRIEDEQLHDRLFRFREMIREVGFEKMYYPDKEREL